jgi:hypothetical protein
VSSSLKKQFVPQEEIKIEALQNGTNTQNSSMKEKGTNATKPS